MDTSEQYIKMCRREEIQEAWKPQKGDCCMERGRSGWDDANFLNESWWYQNPRLIRGVMGGEPMEFEQGDKVDYIWLPFQDQLQKMTGLSPNSLCYRMGRFCPEHEVWGNGFPQVFNSMEQLWLAFVMKEKYGKVWNGETWELSPDAA